MLLAVVQSQACSRSRLFESRSLIPVQKYLSFNKSESARIGVQISVQITFKNTRFFFTFLLSMFLKTKHQITEERKFKGMDGLAFARKMNEILNDKM